MGAGVGAAALVRGLPMILVTAESGEDGAGSKGSRAAAGMAGVAGVFALAVAGVYVTFCEYLVALAATELFALCLSLLMASDALFASD